MLNSTYPESRRGSSRSRVRRRFWIWRWSGSICFPVGSTCDSTRRTSAVSGTPGLTPAVLDLQESFTHAHVFDPDAFVALSGSADFPGFKG